MAGPMFLLFSSNDHFGVIFGESAQTYHIWGMRRVTDPVYPRIIERSIEAPFLIRPLPLRKDGGAWGAAVFCLSSLGKLFDSCQCSMLRQS